MPTPTWRLCAALALPLVLLTGCHRPTGTAWTPGVDGPAGGPATFATPTQPAAPTVASPPALQAPADTLARQNGSGGLEGRSEGAPGNTQGTE